MKPYQAKNRFQISYKKILDDYRYYFVNRQAIIRTNYKPLNEFVVAFNVNDLPHLMGWEKIVDKKAYAKHIIDMVDHKELTYSNSHYHRNFYRIKSRIFNYNFLHEVFLDNDPDVCVMTSDMKPNPLRLDIVFFKHTEPREIVVLGLRKKYNMSDFVPTTLHTESLRNNRYLMRRKTRILSIKWK